MKVELEEIIQWLLFLRCEEGSLKTPYSIVESEARMCVYDEIIEFLERQYKYDR